MERQNYLKQTMRQLAAKTMGSDKSRPRVWTSQQIAENKISAFLARPVEHIEPIQDLRPTVDGDANPNYGKFFFMAGFDAAGDPDKPLR